MDLFGKGELKLNWLYLDLNSYFATIEQQIDRSLRGKPVVVVAVMTDSTSAIAASYEAKLKGIKTGTKIYEAKRLCPELICIKANHTLYVEYHHKILREIDKHLIVDCVNSIDEFACKLTGKVSAQAEVIKIAERIKKCIRQNVGDYISCSIGIAPNKFLSKIATEMDKKDGLVVINPEDIPLKLFSLKLNDIPGVGQRMHKRLRASGITSVEDLFNTDKKLLRKMWGSVWGERCWYLLRGIELPEKKTNKHSIGHSKVLAPEERNPYVARPILLSLLLKAASRLRKERLLSGSLSILIRTTDYRLIKSNETFTAADDSLTLSKITLSLFDRLIISYKHVKIRKIGVILSELQEGIQQLSFDHLIHKTKFDHLSQHKTILSNNIDKINEKYGKVLITIGYLPDRKKLTSGPIAFAYIPQI